MSKAILIIDMPKYCDECQLYSHRGDWCTGANRQALDRNKPSWCPLKEMPLKDERVVDMWNSCIDEILNKD